MRLYEIINETEQLNELFDKVADWAWTHADEYNREAKFDVNGTPYRIKLWTSPQANGVWEAEFVNDSVWSSRWGNTGTMEHEGIQVFGTVISILKKFLVDVCPKYVQFSGFVDEGRDHLYSRMLAHEKSKIKSLGYSFDEQHKGSHAEFTLRRDSEEQTKDA